MKIKEEILVCSYCEGKGVRQQEELTHPHNGEYNRWTTPCIGCRGSGLIQEITTTEFERKPYVPEEAKPLSRVGEN